MSTNFYVMGAQGDMDPNFHVGKRVGIGDGKMAFKWAMDYSRLIEVMNKYGQKCPTCGQEINKMFVDEYGLEYTLQDFNNMLAECSEQSWSSVGQTFC